MSSEPTNQPANLSSRRLDRAALERVLARAAELQAHLADSETAEGLTESQIVDLGREVGLSPEHLRQALAEERTRVALPEDTGLAARLAGPAIVATGRVLKGTMSSALGELDTWMQNEECLTIRRRMNDRIVWEPRRDFMGALRRNLKLGGHDYALMGASSVTATVAQVDESHVHVRLESDLSGPRSKYIGGGIATAGTGGMATVVISAIVFSGAVPIAAPFLPIIGAGALIPAIGGAAAGYGIARAHRGVAERVLIAMDRLLDALEHREVRKPGLLEALQKASRSLPGGFK